MKYYVVVREAINESSHEFHLEARNLLEAAKKVREKYPRHSGYVIKPT